MSKRKQSNPSDEPEATATDPNENTADANIEQPGESVAGDQSDLETELAQAHSQFEEWKDRALRSKAELDNYRKRTQKEILQAREQGVANLAARLLDAMDNLDRALDSLSEEEAQSGLAQGVQMVRQQIADCFQEFHVEQLQPVGTPFDPYLHEALMEEERDDVEPGTIVDQFMSGYRIGDRLLRPAKVRVAKATATNTDQESTEETSPSEEEN